MVLGIYCAGGLGRAVLDLAHAINAKEEVWDEIIFIDDVVQESVINNTNVVNFGKFMADYSPVGAKIVIANGEPRARHTLYDKVTENGYKLQTLIHPTAFIGSETQIKDGAIISYGCFVSCNVIIGTNAALLPQMNIGHDSIIGSNTVLAAHSTVSGKCNIGNRTFIGTNVHVKEKTSIGDDTIIGIGSVVTCDIPNKVVAVGFPARKLRPNESGRVFS